MRVKRSIAAVALPLALLGAGCADDDKASSSDTTAAAAGEGGETTTTAADGGTAAAPAAETIVGVATGQSQFSTLVALVVKAELAEALSGEGPFTVFAPTNAAFGAVPAETLNALAADPTGALADILKLHVVAGKVSAADIPAEGKVVETLNGGSLKIEKMGEALMIGGVKIIVPDVAASNGVIHVIDGVITAPNA